MFGAEQRIAHDPFKELPVIFCDGTRRRVGTTYYVRDVGLPAPFFTLQVDFVKINLSDVTTALDMRTVGYTGIFLFRKTNEVLSLPGRHATPAFEVLKNIN